MQNGRRAAAALVASALGLVAPAAAQAAESFSGVTASGRLITFNSDSPGATRSSVAITGLAAGERLLGLDVRPADRGLYGVGSSGRLYRLNAATGAATAVGSGPFVPRPSGTNVGIDFNPVVDRLRLVTGEGQNLRLNPVTGTVAAVDSPLAYAAGDPGAGRSPSVGAIAYTNSTTEATTTELFGIDSVRDTLVLQSPPNDGVLRTRGALGFDPVAPVGLDIAPSDGRAWASFRRRGKRDVGLWVLDVRNGKAFRAATRNAIGSYVGRKRDPVSAIAARGSVRDDRSPPRVRLRSQSKTNIPGLLSGRSLALVISCTEACRITADILLGNRVVGRKRGDVPGQAGRATVRLKLSSRGRRIVRSRGATKLRVRVNAADAAGNKTSER